MSTISQNGGTIYFRYKDSDPFGPAEIQYSLINQSSWQTASFPITINNLVPSSINVLTVEFTTDLIFTVANNYLICGSSYITFDGNNNTCTYSNIVGYNGLIQNGTADNATGNGYSNITVQNISANSTGSTTLAANKGWICQNYFGKGSSNCIVNNCNSSGAISGDYAGGILGAYVFSVTATNCYSSGAISVQYAGGIFGNNAISVTATNCFSNGTIGGSESGGIFGGYANSVTATNCYSSGAIFGPWTGGIFGRFASSSTATNCYSNGNITGYEAGGIFSANANLGTATNCYSSGTISGLNAGGIFGRFASSTATNCYIANGTWSDTNANATGNLTGTPTLTQNPGTIWGSNFLDTPYYLVSFLPPPPTIILVTAGSTNLTINIEGTNLSNTNSITINGFIHPSQFVIVSNTLITATLENVYPIVSVMVTTNNDISSNIFSINPPIYPTCFPSGTPILTDQGIVAIEKINKKIHTINNKKIIAITQTITNEEHLVCIEKNALGLNIPSEKTIISRCHGVLYNDKMVQARYLKNMVKNKKSIYNIKYNGEMLYNILMEDHDTMSVNNMIVETLDPKNIIAKLYSGKYNEIQKHNLIIEINDCVKKNDFKKIEALRAKL